MKTGLIANPSVSKYIRNLGKIITSTERIDVVTRNYSNRNLNRVKVVLSKRIILYPLYSDQNIYSGVF